MTGLWLAGLLGLIPLFDSWQEALHVSAASSPAAPIVLYVSRTDCTFCLRFEKTVLGPVIRSGEYEAVVFREIVLDAEAAGREFGPLGSSVEHFEEKLGIVGTPTVLFLDQAGNEIARRYVGYVENDYAVFRLERSLREALRR